jgi:hypothetical protein
VIAEIMAAASAAFLVGEFIYHRWTNPYDHQPPSNRQIQIPRSEDGATIPHFYGRVRIRSPLLVWAKILSLVEPDSARAYMLFVLGIPMASGNGTTRVHNMWKGDVRLDKVFSPYGGNVDSSGNWTQTGEGGPEDPITALADLGYIETLNGNPDQILANAPETSTNAVTYAGRAMRTAMPSYKISAYRGYASVFLHGFSLDANPGGWPIARSSEPAYSFEASSYVSGGSYPAIGVYAQSGFDCNPVNVIWDILTASFGKLGLPTSLIDKSSFQVCGQTLYGETHGFSRVFEQMATAEDMLLELLTQIDGVLRENTTTGKLELKLIRPDYTAANLFEINRKNCDELQNLAMGGLTGIVNKVRLIYTNRADNYREGSVTAQNQANAVGQDGIVREVTLRMLGITEPALAASIAARELAARSRPIIKCSALVSRDILRHGVGDAIKLTWSNPDISGLVFRIAAMDRGTLTDRKIRVDLISDFYYSWRQQTAVAVDWHHHLGDLTDADIVDVVGP